MTKMRPLQDRLIVRRVKEEEKSKGGIFIPDTAKEKPTEGEVMAVGNGKVLENGTVRTLDVKVGDRVLFGKYNGNEVKLDGEDLLLFARTRCSESSKRSRQLPSLPFPRVFLHKTRSRP